MTSSANAAQGGDNTSLKGPLTRYAVDLMISARGLQFDLAPDGQHHIRLEAGLMIYDHEGRPLNWLLRQINLNLNAARYAIVQANGVNLYLKIDTPENGASLQSGVYDLSTNLAGTLEIPLNRIVASSPASSK